MNHKYFLVLALNDIILAYVGSNITLKHQLSHGVWLKLQSNGKREILDERYTIDDDFNLNFNVQHQDAGIYMMEQLNFKGGPHLQHKIEVYVGGNCSTCKILEFCAS